jgi:multidrug efflux pump
MGFNLSAWALRNRQIVLFLMILLAAIGAMSYTKLGQSETFTFKAMVIRTLWPGATAEGCRARSPSASKEADGNRRVREDRLVLPPGESQVTFMARDSLHSKDIPELWYQIRKKVADIRHTLPPEFRAVLQR